MSRPVQRGTIDQKIAIQAKRYSEGNKVGQPKIQQYYTLKEQDTDAVAAVVVTTSSFTKDARLWANEHNVKLVDGEDLLEMIERLDAHDLVEEYAPEQIGDDVVAEIFSRIQDSMDSKEASNS
jgi:restriction endonuclease Mrr